MHLFKCTKYKKIKNIKQNKFLLKQCNDQVKELTKNIDGLQVFFDGENNSIIINQPCKFINSTIIIHGNNNEIIIEKTNKQIKNLYIECAQNLNNRKLHIGENIYIEGIKIYMYGNNSICDIGNDCMFSNQIALYTCDGHKILNQASREILNKGSTVKIGNHVWIGRGATICKNTLISDHSIVGTRAVVTKKFKEENIVIAGNPATKVKDNIDWDEECDY